MQITPPPAPQGDPAPGLWATAGLIATYFLLQATAATLFVLVAGAITGLGLTGAEVEQTRQAMLRQPAMQALLAIVSLLVAAPLTLLLAHRRWPRLWSLAKPPGFGFARPRLSIFLALAVAAGLAAPLLGGLLTQWLAQSHTVTQEIRQLGGHAPLGWRIALVLVVVGVGPLAEELLFRGALLSALLKRLPVSGAVAISSLVFALIHLPGLQFQWYALPALTLLALTLAWLRLHSGSIWPAILAHATNNLLAVAVWFVVPGAG